MGRDQLQKLCEIIEEQLASGASNVVTGAWEIRYDKERDAFAFDKCEFGAYCEERPSVIALDGKVLDPGGPLLQTP